MRLWVGQSISVFGSVVGMAAMGFTAILFLHATPFELGVLSAARLAPGFAIGLVAGAWVDRLRRRPILIAVDFARAALLATIPFAALLGRLTIGQLYAVTFFTSLLTVFFETAYQAYLPSLVDREQLMEGNSKLSASASVAEIGGFSIAGWLVEKFGGPITILIDAISFAVSAASILLIPGTEPAPEPSEHPNMRREIVEGLHAVWNHPALRAIAVCITVRSFFLGIFGPLVMLYMTRGLGFQPGVLGTIFAVGGFSSFLGAMIAPRVARGIGPHRSMLWGLLVFGFSIALVPIAHGATLVSGVLLILQQLIGDGAVTVHLINQVTVRQSVTPERLLGRVNATCQFLMLGASLAGSLAGGLLGETIGVRATLFAGALGVIASTLSLIVAPART